MNTRLEKALHLLPGAVEVVLLQEVLGQRLEREEVVQLTKTINLQGSQSSHWRIQRFQLAL